MKRTGFKKLTYEETLAKAKQAQARARERAKAKPKKKKKSRARMIYGVRVWSLGTADEHYSRYIREKRGYTCEHCGFYDAPPTQMIQCSHYLGRSYKAVRFDDDNCDVLCATCHYKFENAKQYEYRDWKLARLGKKRHDALWEKANNSEGEKHAIYELMKRLGKI